MWDGTYVIPETWNPRDPQDFAPPIREQKIFANARSPDEEAESVTAYDLI